MSSTSARKRGIVELIIGLLTLVLLYFISDSLYIRFDLTTEKRYTLDNTTKEVLSNLDDVVHIRIFLDGDLPLGFRKMKRELKETIDEFKVYGDRMFQFEFINPSKSTDKAQRDAFLRDLYDRGLEPANVQERDSRGGTTQRVIFPGALVSYKGREGVVNLLKNNPALSGDENINISIQGFEYSIMSTILKLMPDSLPKLAFVHGHGQLDEFETGDIAQELVDQFEVHRVILGGEVGGLNPYSVEIGRASCRERV